MLSTEYNVHFLVGADYVDSTTFYSPNEAETHAFRSKVPGLFSWSAKLPVIDYNDVWRLAPKATKAKPEDVR